MVQSSTSPAAKASSLEGGSRQGSQNQQTVTAGNTSVKEWDASSHEDRLSSETKDVQNESHSGDEHGNEEIGNSANNPEQESSATGGEEADEGAEDESVGSGGEDEEEEEEEGLNASSEETVTAENGERYTSSEGVAEGRNDPQEPHAQASPQQPPAFGVSANPIHTAGNVVPLAYAPAVQTGSFGEFARSGSSRIIDRTTYEPQVIETHHVRDNIVHVHQAAEPYLANRQVLWSNTTAQGAAFGAGQNPLSYSYARPVAAVSNGVQYPATTYNYPTTVAYPQASGSQLPNKEQTEVISGEDSNIQTVSYQQQQQQPLQYSTSNGYHTTAHHRYVIEEQPPVPAHLQQQQPVIYSPSLQQPQQYITPSGNVAITPPAGVYTLGDQQQSQQNQQFLPQTPSVTSVAYPGTGYFTNILGSEMPQTRDISHFIRPTTHAAAPTARSLSGISRVSQGSKASKAQKYEKVIVDVTKDRTDKVVNEEGTTVGYIVDADPPHGKTLKVSVDTRKKPSIVPTVTVRSKKSRGGICGCSWC